jgi:hypothetical protein
MRRRPKITSAGRIIRAECVFADIRGSKDALMFLAERAIDTVLKSTGPNAAGEFHVRASFWPDGGYLEPKR